MAVYYKPQSPIQSGEDFIYPITTADQIVKSDNSRRLEQAGLIVADNSTSLGGVAAKDYARKTDTAPDSSKLGGKSANEYALKTDTAPDSSKLGGKSANEYALKTDTAPDSAKLGGKTLAEIMLALYPVGAVYISVNSTSPASLFGGTWERIMDRFLLGAGDAYAAGSTGGEETVALTTEQMPSHTHTPTDNTPGTSTYNQYGMQVLRHLSSVSTARSLVAKGSDYYVNAANPKASDYGSLEDVSVMYKTGATGGGTAHNNMPPYLAVYMWRRVS